jgi:galactose mutarotase-like enzyme
MVTTISNGQLTARISRGGAELTSLFNNALRLEYMWAADARYWAKSSPILFPIVGALKGGSYIFNGKNYRLSRHGFARDWIFDVESQEPSTITFLLRDDEDTRTIYPFPFELRLIYSLDGFQLNVTYEVVNPSDEKLLFSIGGHPAFKVPLIPGTVYEDYFLKFDQQETSSRWPITRDGLIDKSSKPFFNSSNILPLTRELFFEDAVVLKDLKSSTISIRSNKHTHGLDFSFPGFPYFGIWAFKDADFVCLEPWCGIADSVTHDQRLENKEGIIALAGNSRWEKTWTVKCY